MVALRWLIVSIWIPLAGLGAFGQASTTGKSVLEKVEWTWADRPVAPDRNLPNVLLLGDSIARAYFPDVSRLLAGGANA